MAVHFVHQHTDVEWFADALLDNLVSEVARLPGSFVIARATAHTYKGKVVDPRDVARELRVRYVVRGSLRREGTVIRLNLGLIDGENGRQRWAEKFTVESAQLGQALRRVRDRARAPFEYRDAEVGWRSLGRAVARRGVGRRLGDARVRPMGSGASTAIIYIEALGLLEQAVAKNPNSARAWGGLVFMNVNGVVNGWLPDRAEASRRIDEAAVQLDRLDPDGVFAYMGRAVQAFFRRDFPAHLRITEAWVKHHQHPAALGGYGIGIDLQRTARRGNPSARTGLCASARATPSVPNGNTAWRLRISCSAQYEQAREWGQTAQASNPGLTWPPVHAAAIARLGQQAEAKKVFDEIPGSSPRI